MSATESTGATDERAAQAWVKAFAEGWRAPTNAQSFVAHFHPWLHPEIRMVQPQLPTLVGYDAFLRGFAEPLFALVPDLRGDVEDWAASGGVLYIVLTLTGTLGGRPVTLRSCDRVTLRDGRAIERVAFVDPTPLLRAAVGRPRAWPAFARYLARTLTYRIRRNHR